MRARVRARARGRARACGVPARPRAPLWRFVPRAPRRGWLLATPGALPQRVLEGGRITLTHARRCAPTTLAFRLPRAKGWWQYESEEGTPYFFNEDTEETRWTHPSNEVEGEDGGEGGQDDGCVARIAFGGQQVLCSA